jgi:antitoxin component of MazEF toxin-antitoxin module
MSKALSRHSSLRQSGNSIVVTVPVEIVRELDLNDGDSVFWTLTEEGVLTLNIKRLLEIIPDEYFTPMKLLTQESVEEPVEETEKNT